MEKNMREEGITEHDPFWKCLECGNTVQLPSPPEICPSCKEKCAFKDVTCYHPGCGGPGNIDPQL